MLPVHMNANKSPSYSCHKYLKSSDRLCLCVCEIVRWFDIVAKKQDARKTILILLSAALTYGSDSSSCKIMTLQLT